MYKTLIWLHGSFSKRPVYPVSASDIDQIVIRETQRGANADAIREVVEGFFNEQGVPARYVKGSGAILIKGSAISRFDDQHILHELVHSAIDHFGLSTYYDTSQIATFVEEALAYSTQYGSIKQGLSHLTSEWSHYKNTVKIANDVAFIKNARDIGLIIAYLLHKLIGRSSYSYRELDYAKN